MPHRPRIQLDQVPLHIVQRGHNCRCFEDEGEFEAVKYSTPFIFQILTLLILRYWHSPR